MQVINQNQNPVAVVTFDAGKCAEAVCAIIAGIDAKATLVADFRDLTYDAFTGRQKIVISKLVTLGVSSNETAASLYLQRAFAACGIKKPDSTNPDAIRKAEERKVNAEKAKAAAAAMIEQAKATAAASGGNADDLITTAALSGDKVAAAIIADKMKAAEKAVKESTAEKRKTVANQIKDASPERLDVVSVTASEAGFFHDVIVLMRKAGLAQKLSTFDQKLKDDVIKALERALKVKLEK